MTQKQTKYMLEGNEKICKIDLEEGNIQVHGMEREKCRRLLKNLLEGD